MSWKNFYAQSFLLVILITSMTCVAEMTDYEAINNLIVSERLYSVSHRNKELAECYTEDAQIRTSWQSGGTYSFIGRSPVESNSETFNINRCSGALIHMNGSKAFVEYPSTTTRSVKVNGTDAILTSYMRLLYRVEKRSGVWKIVDILSLNEADELNPLIPGENLNINPDDIKDLRISYRWLSYTRKIVGGEVNNNLPGVDRPEEVNKIYREAFTLLND